MRKHDHWKDVDLPRATKDIHRLRKDMYEWGFCLIEDGLFAEAPVLVNVVYVLDDVNEVNGGTLMIPGSHKIVSEVGGGEVGELPPAINTEAKAGSVLLMDGRLLHRTGGNHG